jgi:hypothetical protein
MPEQKYSYSSELSALSVTPSFCLGVTHTISSYVPRDILFFCVAKRKGETQKSCPAHMQTARPLLSCSIAPLAIKDSSMTELVAKMRGI